MCVSAFEERKYMCAYATVRAESSHPPDAGWQRRRCSPAFVRIQYSHNYSVVCLWVWARALVRAHEHLCCTQASLNPPPPTAR